jgi:hypothetical protein
MLCPEPDLRDHRPALRRRLELGGREGIGGSQPCLFRFDADAFQQSDERGKLLGHRAHA